MFKSSIVSLLFLTLFFLLTATVEASFPTNRNVTASTVPISPGNPNEEVVINVVDEQRGQTITWRSSVGYYTNPTILDGVVSWGGQNGQNVTFNYAVYDPGCGCVKLLTSLPSPGNTASLTRGGVVSWDEINYPFGQPPAYIKHRFATYDPELGNWVVSETASDPDHTGGSVISDTMVAWAEIIYPISYPNDPAQIIFYFRVYDPLRKSWKHYASNVFNAPGSSYGIENGTGLFTAQGTSYKVGYNADTGLWAFNSFSTPFSYFVASNATGNIPLKTYFWDMSLGASQWTWTFGDGGSASDRSPFYTFNSAVSTPYTVTQTVIGPGGNDSSTRIVTPTTVHSISGSASNLNGFTIAGATVNLSGTISRTTQTDTNGNYSFTNLTGSGNYTVSISKSRYGFIPSNRTFNNLSGGQTGSFVGKLNKKPSDFDGDNKSDVSIFRPSTGYWWTLNSSDSSVVTASLGAGTDVLTPRDFDGDGRTDVAVWRPSEGKWYVIQSSNSTMITAYFGISGDIPVANDYDGDDKADFAVFRPSNQIWYIFKSSNSQVFSFQYGISTDKPVSGDYDGDGKADLAVFRSSNFTWYFMRSSDASFVSAQFGDTNDKLIQGDYDADGKTDFATFRPSDLTWRVKRSSDGMVSVQNWGLGSDILTPGDFDGDGKHDYGVFRPSSALWYIMRSSDQTWYSSQFGLNGDQPTLTSYIAN